MQAVGGTLCETWVAATRMLAGRTSSDMSSASTPTVAARLALNSSRLKASIEPSKTRESSTTGCQVAPGGSGGGGPWGAGIAGGAGGGSGGGGGGSGGGGVGEGEGGKGEGGGGEGEGGGGEGAEVVEARATMGALSTVMPSLSLAAAAVPRLVERAITTTDAVLEGGTAIVAVMIT